MYYIGLDVHNKTISYCVKDVSGQMIQQEGKVGSTRRELNYWMKTLPQPWTVAMEATILKRRQIKRDDQCADCPRLSSNCFGTGREHKLNLL